MSHDNSDDDGGASHERWLLSYADFVTLLFAFFTVMYSVSVVNVSKYHQFADSISEAIGVKQKFSKFAEIGTESKQPITTKYEFLNNPVFEVTPSFNFDDSKEEIEAKLEKLLRQQNALRVLMEPGGPIQYAIASALGDEAKEIEGIFNFLSDQVIQGQRSSAEYQNILNSMYLREEATNNGLHDNLKTTRSELSDVQAGLHDLQSSLTILQAENSKLVNIIRRSRQQLDDNRRTNRLLLNGYQERSKILDLLQKRLASEGVDIEVDLATGVLRLPEALLFSSGRADFSLTGKKSISILSKNLFFVLPCYTLRDNAERAKALCQDELPSHYLESIFIEGHTDDLPISNDEFKDNWDLSFRRAKNTFLELMKTEPRLNALNNLENQALIGFSSYADRRPLDTNKTDAGRRKNRRIDLRLIMIPAEWRGVPETIDIELQ